MRTEPTAIIEIVRAIALLLGFAGVVITVEEQAVIAAGIGALAALVSVALAIWNRRSVFSPKTTQAIANRAAATGNTDIGNPPSGNLEG